MSLSYNLNYDKIYKNMIYKILIISIFFFLFFGIFYEYKNNLNSIEKNIKQQDDSFSKINYSERNFSQEKDAKKIEIKEEKEEKIEDNLQKNNNNRVINNLEKEYSKDEWKYIFNLAESKGYKKREEIDLKQLGKIDGILLSKVVIDDFKNMKSDLQKQGIKINLLSGFRSVDDQKRIFLRKLGEEYGKILTGESDNKINNILIVSSPPGYSKHHTGETMDLSCGNSYSLTNKFMDTKCYRWLSLNNFENAKKYNFYPSYPEGVKNQGPNPESWEFIWKK